MAGRLAGAEGEVTRLRLLLRGERGWRFRGGGVLSASGELGLRHDGGDAETGTGVEVGAGVGYASGALSVEGRVRGLLAHGDAGYAEWGASGSVRVAPDGSGRGLSFELVPEWGRAGGAAQRMWSVRDAGTLAVGEAFEAERRLRAELGYGFGTGGVGGARGMLTPYAGLTLGDGGPLRLGTRWRLGPAVELRLETAHGGSGAAAPADTLALRVALRF